MCVRLTVHVLYEYEHPVANLFVLYIGQADATGNSWCPDCNDIKTVLSAIPANSILLECQVSTNGKSIQEATTHCGHDVFCPPRDQRPGDFERFYALSTSGIQSSPLSTRLILCHVCTLYNIRDLGYAGMNHMYACMYVCVHIQQCATYYCTGTLGILSSIQTCM